MNVWVSNTVPGLEPISHDDRAPELSDLRRYGRRVVKRFVAQAREDERETFRSLISAHLGTKPADLPVVEETWPAYEHVNVQAALDAWLATPGRTHRVIGLSNYRHRGPFGIGDLMSVQTDHALNHPIPGNPARVNLPCGSDGLTRACLRAAVVLVREDDGSDPVVLLLRGPEDEHDRAGVSVEAVSVRLEPAQRATAELRALALQLNVYRGQVVSFGADTFGERESLLRFHTRVPMREEDLVLPAETFSDLRRQVVGVARNRDRLRAAGQHLKRGLLLYGPPGVGKTHTVRFLIGELGDTTIVELTGDSLGAIKQACSIARSLQPSMVVVEDVDLIAEQRDHYGGQTPLLFTLLNEMDGLAEDADVVFLLTTNRADLLEPALAARPGRVDQAVHIGLPSRDDRARLVELYRGELDLDTSHLDAVLDRTDGVTASFLKELLRRAAVTAADRDGEPGAGRLRVDATELDQALDDLLDTRNAMTRSVLGFNGDDTGPSAPVR